MLNSEKKRSLIDWCDRNPVRAIAVFRRCAGALILFGLVALSGMESDLNDEAASARMHAYRPLDASLSQAHALYMARQQQFMSSHSTNSILAPAARASSGPTEGWDRREE